MVLRTNQFCPWRRLAFSASAGALDRFPFPGSQAAGLKCEFEGVRNAFHHPLVSNRGESFLLATKREILPRAQFN
jgi:hypothetical protein